MLPLLLIALLGMCGLSQQLNLVSGRMSPGGCDPSTIIDNQPKVNFCGLVNDVESWMTKINDPESRAIIEKAMNTLSQFLRNETEAAMLSIIMLNRPMIEDLRNKDPANFNKILGVLGYQYDANGQIVPVSNAAATNASVDFKTLCTLPDKLNSIKGSLSADDKQALGGFLCGIHETLKKQLPKIMSQVISKQNFLYLLQKDPAQMKELGNYFSAFLKHAMN